MNTTAITATLNGNISTCIAFASYCHATRTLDVEFQRTPGRTYRFRGVAAVDWNTLVNAPSLGKKWNELFRTYPFTSLSSDAMSLAA